MQMNIQELQTLKYLNLNVAIVIMNNFGYGIIKQFQDSYTDSRYHATGEGYSTPSFQKIANAYEINYVSIKKVDDVNAQIFEYVGPQIIEVLLHPNTAIEPKLEMGHSIEDQFPYVTDIEYNAAMKKSVQMRNNVMTGIPGMRIARDGERRRVSERRVGDANERE